MMGQRNPEKWIKIWREHTMKKFKNTAYWLGVLVSYFMAFILFAFIICVALGLPDTMLGGIIASALILVGLVFGARDETLEILKRYIRREPLIGDETENKEE